MFTKKTIRDVELKNKTVLLRADYNVPLKAGHITDDYRIKQSLETVNYLLKKKVKLIICSHLGRPDGKASSALSLHPVAERLRELLEREVGFAHDCVGNEAAEMSAKLKSGQILLLENLRFHPEEEANDPTFAKKLAGLSEVFVQDGFGVVHRAHASTEGVTHFLPSVAGLLLEREVDTITKTMEEPKRPLAAIVGGAKVSDKLEILRRFITKADFLAVGGALANPFLAAGGVDIKSSLLDPADLPLAKEILLQAAEESKKRDFVLAVPHDAVVAKSIDKQAETRVVDFSSNSYADIVSYPKRVRHEDTHLRAGEKVLDIGPFSASFIAGAVQLSSTVVWNGTMGVTETDSLEGPIGPFAHGTETIIEALNGDLGHKPFTVVGGGDTVGYIESRKMINCFNHVSTGGGASMELMSGHKLPGVEALLDKNEVQ
ncbi:MAG TPA: phosphoglycerate kinase [Candidatus Saccharimonadales bacterium]|nr:phosphoglycerate kinase [Candidatus Saccharimonadales bacterium]